MKYLFRQLDEHLELSDYEEGYIKTEVRQFFHNRGISNTEWIEDLFIEHFVHMSDLGYTFLFDTENVTEGQEKFILFLHYLIEQKSPLLIVYAKDKDITFGSKDTNTWTDNDRTTQGRTDYGSTSRTAGEDSPLGSDPIGAITTPAEKSANEITGGASRTEVKSGSSTETRIRSDETEQLKQYWSGFKNFDGLIHNIFTEMTDEYITVY